MPITRSESAGPGGKAGAPRCLPGDADTGRERAPEIRPGVLRCRQRALPASRAAALHGGCTAGRAMARPWFAAVTGLVLLSLCSNELSAAEPQNATEEFHIGITPVILADRPKFLQDWQDYLSQRLSRPTVFVQRKSYKEVMDLLLQGNLDMAWVCGYPFVRHRDKLKLIAVPLWRGQPVYRSYLIVRSKNHTVSDITELEQSVFAYSDPDSNSGFLVPQYQLISHGIDPNRFFRRTFFTWSHKDVIAAVAAGVADAGAVDGYIWESLAKTHPELTSQTRVAWRSPQYGFPPLVALRQLAESSARELQAALIGMATDAEGQEILARLNLDGFSVQEPDLFDGILRQMRFVDDAVARSNEKP